MIAAARRDPRPPAQGRPLRVGLVNNMPDAALASTERQFRDLLKAAAPDRDLDLQLFQIAGIKRHPDIRASLERRYQPVDAIPGAGLAALIVTGADAGLGALREAPFWESFARLVDLTVAQRLSTLWSCLAAHAAVEHLDGIKRRPLKGGKRVGFYPIAPVRPDPLLAGVDREWRVPNSRYNGVSGDELRAKGYEILTASGEADPDVFIRRGPPLFLFCQGHPEYDRDSIVLEYRRDVRAYLQGEAATPPNPPVGAPDAQMAEAFAQLTAAAAERRSPENLPSDLSRAAPEWRPFAVGLYGNWLRAVA